MYQKLMLNDKKLMLNDETRRSMEYVSTTHVKYAYKKVTSWYLYQGIIG